MSRCSSSAVLELAQLPAALLIGPMLAAIIAGTNGATIRPKRIVFMAAQAIVGCLIAASIPSEIFASFFAEWPLFLGIVLATLAASSLLGYLISRWKVLPGTTAVWGSTPGAASAMVLMADAFGADARLVAFMQYLRVIFVSRGGCADRPAVGRHVGRRAGAADRLVPADRLARRSARRSRSPPVGAGLGRLLRLPAGTFPRPDDARRRRCISAARRRAAAAAMAAGGQLCRDRLVDRAQFHAHDPAACGACAAADHRLDRRADRVLRRARLCAEPRRSASIR